MSTDRKRHDKGQVLVAAEEIVDREGWQHLTMTALAAELGVKVPSLYNHVPNLEALRGELQSRTLHALGRELNRSALGRSGPTALRALATTFRRFAKEHPGLYDLAMRAPIDAEALEEATLEAGAALLAVIQSYGISEAAYELQVTMFAALHGAVVLENANFFPSVIDLDQVYENVLGLVLGLLDDHAPGKARAS